MHGYSIVLLLRVVVQDGRYVWLFDDVAIGTLALVDAAAVRGEGGPYLTEEAYHFIAVGALFGIDRNLLTDHAG